MAKENSIKRITIKIKIINKRKENSIKMKGDPTVWENIFANDTLGKYLVSKYIQNSHNSTPGRQTTQFKNGQKTSRDTSPRKTYRWPRDI